MTVGEAFTFFIKERQLNGGSDKTARNYQSTARSLIAVVGDVPAEFLAYEHIMSWKIRLDAEGKASSTISSYLSSLREVLKYLRKHRYNVLDPRDIELPRVIIGERDYLTPDEVQIMVDHAIRPRDKAIIATLFSSGGRITEVLNLNRDSVKDGKAYLLGKNSKMVTLRIDRRAEKYIGEYLESRNDKLPAIFISSQMRRLTVQRAEQIVSQIAGELNFKRHDGAEKRVTPHTLRHSFATDLLYNGADLVSTSKLMNHSSIYTTRIYTHVNEPRQDEIFARFHSD